MPFDRYYSFTFTAGPGRSGTEGKGKRGVGWGWGFEEADAARTAAALPGGGDDGHLLGQAHTPGLPLRPEVVAVSLPVARPVPSPQLLRSPRTPAAQRPQLARATTAWREIPLRPGPRPPLGGRRRRVTSAAFPTATRWKWPPRGAGARPKGRGGQAAPPPARPPAQDGNSPASGRGPAASAGTSVLGGG